MKLFNTAFLRDTNKLNEFKIALNNRFQALQNLLKEEETTMEDNWEGIKEALTSTCQEVLGLKKHHHKEWISIETLDRIKEKGNKTAIDISQTRAEKVQGQAEFIDANKQVKKSIEADKQKHIKELATTEEAAREGNELLNRPALLNPPDIEASPTDLSIDVTPPTIEEIRMAIRQSWKAERPDNIPDEALKSHIEVTTNMFDVLFMKIWEEEQVLTG
ncbi:unnamed protein product [Schistosoma curassoni]|uniref:Uncharacterized protein n=1 Tax=Schistosoma curassoni TaxID=6186 RepID=A0A183JJG2_9TREM|nr:unnamed protein product [Schistosoma curassoni]